MSVDGLALSAQRAVDRLIRRLRRGAPPTPTHRRFLVVQIDGLARAVLDEALASGRMPFLAHLLERRDYRLEPTCRITRTCARTIARVTSIGSSTISAVAVDFIHEYRRSNCHAGRPTS